MLVRLIYASRAAEAVTPESLAAITKTSRNHNLVQGITGVLIFSDGVFLQLLEGGRDAVSALYNAITHDKRHKDVVLLSYDEIGERRFAGWAMGQANLSRLNPGVLLKYSDRPVLDPYTMSARATIALFDELVATAVISCPGQ
ncbi:BLUF domain-containing protein [Piscinibacter terrae]|uniref:BLUF domain-containing protein n=1 Tax=Piscinibacter terrae TaxID=2496871 RepID=A0A3N7HMZ4_9BURK|nr:BLUF domain-containing protein [Albitalea terrae]RQP22456.1 BLUF domain-containing protein [Albitalea terrae]